MKRQGVRWQCLNATAVLALHVRILNAFTLDLFGFGVYIFPQGAAGAMSFHDPLEGTEISLKPGIDNPDLHHSEEVIGDLRDELVLILSNPAPPPSRVRLELEQDGLQSCNP